MDQPERPHIGLLLYEELPPQFEEGFIDKLGTGDVRVHVLRIPAGPFAGIQDYLPAAIGIFIASSYFGGMLKKVGEDHYLAFKDIAKQLWKRSSLLRLRAIGSEGKVSAKPKFSIAYSITGEVIPRLSFKLILRLEAGEEEADAAIAAFLDLLRQLHEGKLNESDLSAILTHRPVGGIVLVTFDPDEKRIVAVDGMSQS